MSRTIRNLSVSRKLSYFEIDRMLGDKAATAYRAACLARYWKAMDRALVLSLRDGERSAHYANEARKQAIAIGRSDLAFHATEVLGIVVGGY